MYVGLKQPRGDGERYVTPARAAAKETTRLLVCFLVQFDLLFAFGVLSCRILDSASLFILFVHDHNRLGFGMLTVETAVFDCIC